MLQRLGFLGHSRQRLSIVYSWYHEWSFPEFCSCFLSQRWLWSSPSVFWVQLWEPLTGSGVVQVDQNFYPLIIFLRCLRYSSVGAFCFFSISWHDILFSSFTYLNESFRTISKASRFFIVMGTKLSSIFQMRVNNGFVEHLESFKAKVPLTRLDQHKYCVAFFVMSALGSFNFSLLSVVSARHFSVAALFETLPSSVD